jgi:uncharacterized protein YjbI with pentapeptide repeats
MQRGILRSSKSLLGAVMRFVRGEKPKRQTFQGDSEHLAKLQEGVAAWNAWRKENPEIRPDLKGLDFTDPVFRSTSLWIKDGQRVSILGIDLSHTLCLNANFSGANCRNANFSDAMCDQANFSDAYCYRTNFSDAFCYKTNFSGANCSWSNFSGAICSLSNFSGANCGRANFTGANCFASNFSATILHRADFSQTEVLAVNPLPLDSTIIRDTQFSPNAYDRWSVLRRAYTGPAMLFNFVFMLLFFAPVIAKALGLWAFGQVQSGLECSAEAVIPCRTVPVWEILFGFHEPLSLGNVMPGLTVGLIIYQFWRFNLTRKVSLMRDAEERSGVSPPLKGRWGYDGLFWFEWGRLPYLNWRIVPLVGIALHRQHLLLKVLVLFAFGMLVWRGWQFLIATEVPLWDDPSIANLTVSDVKDWFADLIEPKSK